MTAYSALPEARTSPDRPAAAEGDDGAAGGGPGRPRAASRIDRADLTARLGAAGQSGRVRGDFDLNPLMQRPTRLRPAAVLVPLVDRGDHWTVLLTQRTQTLTAHAGQISFPGGAREPGDADGRATALRETQEEIGLTADRIALIGRLDTYITRTHFEVEPCVGVVSPPFSITLDAREVDEAFEVPLDVFLGDAAPMTHRRLVAGREKAYYVFAHGHRTIWGATAGMLVNLREVLLAEH